MMTEETDAEALSPEEHERIAGGQQLVLGELRALLMARLASLLREPTATEASVLAFVTVFGRALKPLALHELLRDAPVPVRGAITGLHKVLAVHNDDFRRTAALVTLLTLLTLPTLLTLLILLALPTHLPY
jgi:hypothetical protein